jgi:hypothetical protein
VLQQFSSNTDARCKGSSDVGPDTPQLAALGLFPELGRKQSEANLASLHQVCNARVRSRLRGGNARARQ